MNDQTRHYLLKTVALALPALAAMGFTQWTGRQPPRNPVVPTVSWKHAILWTALAGALGGVARMASRRILANRLPVER